ncbi:DUF4245 domain-containing protein [Brevibacterium daeguense]|uniref:DUF4245 domain-containing protein n=1 Tax=Brevibacterium daeguense TaxID=909936 RepID=UPI001F297883
MNTQQEPRVQPGSRDEMRQLRTGANWVNMAIALGACLIVVLAALAFVPRPETELTREIDYVGVAQSAQQDAEFRLAVPELPEGWVSNEASFRPMGSPESETWYVSWVGPERGWVSLRQSQGDENWVKSMLDEDMLQTGARDIAGESFATYEDSGARQALVGEVGETTLVLKGTAPWETFDQFASQIVEDAKG